MKTIILVLLIAISTDAFSQARFSKRKYMKGIFTEKRHRIKTGNRENMQHVATTNKAVIPDHVSCFDTSVALCTEVDSGVVGNVAVADETIVSEKKGPVVSENQLMPDVSPPVPKYCATMSAGKGDVHWSRSGNLIIKPAQQMFLQEQKARRTLSLTFRNYGNGWGDLLEGLKRLALIILMIMMVLLLFTSILAIVYSPVASLSWGLGIAIAIYAVIGIIISIVYLCDGGGSRFMDYLTAIFAVASLILLY